MARRLALALPRPDAPRIAVRVPWRRVALATAVTLVLAALGYVTARETPLFAVKEIQVVGGNPRARRDVASALADLRGKSLVAVDGSALADSLAQLPSVRSAKVDRAFPHDLRVVVVPERVAAVVRSRSGSWLVAADGRVVDIATERAARTLPTIRVAPSAHVRKGGSVEGRGARDALAVLTSLPRGFPAIERVRARGGWIVLRLAGGAHVRLGTPDRLETKLVVAARVLHALHASGRASLVYLDVSVPERPVSRS